MGQLERIQEDISNLHNKIDTLLRSISKITKSPHEEIIEAREIALILGLSVNTIKQRWHKMADKGAPIFLDPDTGKISAYRDLIQAYKDRSRRPMALIKSA